MLDVQTFFSTFTSQVKEACKSHGRQSDKLFLQSSELGLLQPLTRRRVCPSPGSGGRGTFASERGVGRVPIPTREHALWYSLYCICVCDANKQNLQYRIKKEPAGYISKRPDVLKPIIEPVTNGWNFR
jgi:hypothetical protein